MGAGSLWPLKSAKLHDTNRKLFHSNDVEKMKDINTSKVGKGF
jgi:hypothetical protein